MNDIVQLKITLAHTKPPIWRRVLVDKKTSFFELHHIIQIAMGWENCHLFEFKVHSYRIGEPDIDDSYAPHKLVDANTVTLESVLTEAQESFVYEYDFGDGWVHNLKVEKYLPRDAKTTYPLCIKGAQNCPPEDCGGVGGYYYMLDALSDKKHPEYREMKTWLGSSYDAGLFDLDETNTFLKAFAAHFKR